MLPSYFRLFLLFASLSDAQVLNGIFQGHWVNGNETTVPDAQECISVTQTAGSSVTYEVGPDNPQPSGSLTGRLPADHIITAEVDGVAISLPPITTANPTGCNNLLYTFALPAGSQNLTFTFVGSAANNDFFG
jgi:hypothetical protein